MGPEEQSAPLKPSSHGARTPWFRSQKRIFFDPILCFAAIRKESSSGALFFRERNELQRAPYTRRRELIRLLPMLWMSFIGVAYAETPTPACVLGGEQIAPKTTEAYVAALQIETRKLGLPLKWESVTNAGECKEQPVLFVSDTVQLSIGSNSHEFDLSKVGEASRPRTVAASVLNRIQEDTQRNAAPLPLLSADTISMGGKQKPIVAERLFRPTDSRKTHWILRLGGGYSVQQNSFGLREKTDRHSGGPTLEVGVSMFKDHLSLSLAGRYGWGSLEVGLDEPLQLATGEVLTSVRGGGQLGNWCLRAGAGLGWRSQRNPYWEATEDREKEDWKRKKNSEIDLEWLSTTTAVLEFEVAWQFTERWQLSLVTGPQFDFKAISYIKVEDEDEKAIKSPPSFRSVLSLGVRL